MVPLLSFGPRDGLNGRSNALRGTTADGHCRPAMHVEMAEPIDRRFHGGFPGGRQGDVADMYDGTLALRVDLVRGRLSLGTITTINDNRAAIGDEPRRDLFSSPPAGEGLYFR